MKKQVFLFTLLMIVSVSGAYPHGIEIESEMQFPAVILKASFSATHAVNDAKVTIISPDSPDKAYQTGRTDKAGYFAFIPDMAGDWKLTVDDQKGHTKETVIAVSSDFFNPSVKVVEAPAFTAETPKQELPMLFKIILGLSLIIGITGFYYGIKAKQSGK